MPENTSLNISSDEVGKALENAVDPQENALSPDEVGKTLENAVDPQENCDIPSYDIAKFKLERILNNNTVRKSIALLGKFPENSADDLAIILFEKEAFTEESFQTDDFISGVDAETTHDAKLDEKSKDSFFNKELKVKTEFINNIYGSFKCVPSADLNGVKTTIVYPATSKHIEKYSISQRYLINETPALYENLTLPYLEACQFSLEWVYNILEHKQEKERIIFEDADPVNGFILLPDLKWDGVNLDALYILVIIRQRNIKSLRDLTADHLPLLRSIHSKSAEVIQSRYSITASQLRMYLHYQPSFYHLHIHINPVKTDAPGIWCEKSHMLSTVINNIELIPDYYQRATLPFTLYDSSKLLEKYEEEMEIRKYLKTSTDDAEKNGNEC